MNQLERFGNSLQMLKSKLRTGLMDGKGINRISPIHGTDNFEIECDNDDIYLLRITPMRCSVLYNENSDKKTCPYCRIELTPAEIEKERCDGCGQEIYYNHARDFVKPEMDIGV